jgi:predicted RND superfamily exporter protein
MHAPSPALIPETLAQFDPASGSMLERSVFNHRKAVMLACAIVTVLLAIVAVSRLTLSASFEKMIPRSHPYIQNYLENRNELRGLGNALRIVVENPNGDIYDPKYENTLKKIHDEVFLTPASTAPG